MEQFARSNHVGQRVEHESLVEAVDLDSSLQPMVIQVRINSVQAPVVTPGSIGSVFLNRVTRCPRVLSSQF